MTDIELTSEEKLNIAIIKQRHINDISNKVGLKLSQVFKEYCKPTNKPHLPNFNKSILIHNLMTYLTINHIYNISADNLYEIILELNNKLEIYYSKNNSKTINIIQTINKKSTKLYLFVESDNFTNMLI